MHTVNINEAKMMVKGADGEWLTLTGPSEDLFIVGDAHQRIYRHQVTLSRVGIDIRGRGRKLRVNYRDR